MTESLPLLAQLNHVVSLILLAFVFGHAFLFLCHIDYQRNLLKASCVLLLSTMVIDLAVTSLLLTEQSWSALSDSLILVITKSQIGLLLVIKLLASLCLVLSQFLLTAVWRQGCTVLSCLIISYSLAANGHSAEAGLWSYAVVIHTTHLLAGCTWLGMIWLYLYYQTRAYVQIVYFSQQLSEWALICFLAILLTGFADGIRMWQWSQGNWTTHYSQLLGLKLGFLLLALVLAAYNRFLRLGIIQQHGRIDRGFNHILLIESLLLVGIFIVATTLANTDPSS
ncbi:CopD family protein [Agitococcus lubricus]|uniref:CopD family protein n=1 Tax=Agitococcus lubricus TaxID=1077255 RepID=UPI0014734F09|nr:CopD family protein [Agitococcus lubricus]